MLICLFCRRICSRRLHVHRSNLPLLSDHLCRPTYLPRLAARFFLPHKPRHVRLALRLLMAHSADVGASGRLSVQRCPFGRWTYPLSYSATCTAAATSLSALLLPRLGCSATKASTTSASGLEYVDYSFDSSFLADTTSRRESTSTFSALPPATTRFASHGVRSRSTLTRTDHLLACKLPTLSAAPPSTTSLHFTFLHPTPLPHPSLPTLPHHLARQ